MDEKSAFLGEEKISKLLFKLSTPVIIGMLSQALYNIIDTLFIGKAYGAVWWFVLCDMLTVILFVIFPQIVTFLPDTMRQM